MIRRNFITLLGGAAVAWPLAARAQQSGRLPTIGYLGSGTPATQGQWVAAFVQRLRELGWIDGRTVAIEYRWAEGRDEHLAEIAAEFVRLKVDVIVTSSAAPVLAAKQATSAIPIVVAVAADPVGTGLVASLARPGGNVTGLSSQYSDLAPKKVELLREALLGLRRLAVMANINAPGAVLEMGVAQAAGRKLGLEVAAIEIQRTEDIAPAIESLKGRADAAFNIAGFTQSVVERADKVHKQVRRCTIDETDHRHRQLLRLSEPHLGREQQTAATGQCNKLTPSDVGHGSSSCPGVTSSNRRAIVRSAYRRVVCKSLG
jgi:hypothetical protein